MDLSGATVAELSAELVARTASPESLDRAFTLPEWMTDENLREVYEVIVARMRREAAHIPMNTVQQLLIERIALNYIIMKFREGRPLGDEQGFQHAGVIKDWNTFWLASTREFADLMLKFRPSDKEAVLTQVRDVLTEVLGTIDDAALRSDLLRRFVSTFDRAGL
jgi:hypothetical protein